MKKLIFASLILLATQVQAHQLTLYGTRPYISLSTGLGARWDLNVFYSETVNTSDTVFNRQHFAPRDVQSYFQTGATFKYSPNLNFTAGYVFQRNNPIYKDFSNENRLWQQALFSHNMKRVSIAHRFRFEERFIENRATKHTDSMATRLRYQLGFTVPLEGEEIDPTEFFFSTYNESYLSLTGARMALYSENWTYAGLGYQTASLGRIELGPLAQWAKIDKAGDSRMFYLVQLGWSYTF